MRLFLSLILSLLLSLPVSAMTEREAVLTVVNHLRVQLLSSERYHVWEQKFADWFEVRELRPYTEFF